jgi:sugar phosphate isomerase/epimerase
VNERDWTVLSREVLSSNPWFEVVKSRVEHPDGSPCDYFAVEFRRLAFGIVARDRGCRFRIPGWGDVDWKRLLTELRLANLEGVLAVEHEDPTMSRLDGLVKARDYLSVGEAS